jgi:7-cyano-7-deazaguanine synthase
MKKAVILISGGADSATLLAIAVEQGWQLHAISFNYGQRHLIELEKAKAITSNKVASHLIIDLDRSVFSSSALVNRSYAVDKFNSVADITNEVPTTYVPGRNNLFLSYALSYAESIAASQIFIGIHASDFAQYPDCRPEFIAKFQELVNVATCAVIKISAPLINMNKTQVIHEGLKRTVDYATTISCYDPNPDGLSCAHCVACQHRLAAFVNNDAVDPIPYANKKHST